MWTNDDEGDEIKDALQLQTNIHKGHKTQHNTTTITIKLLTDAKDTRWWSLPDQLVVRGGVTTINIKGSSRGTRAVGVEEKESNFYNNEIRDLPKLNKGNT